jgi:hypothetical protein
VDTANNFLELLTLYDRRNKVLGIYQKKVILNLIYTTRKYKLYFESSALFSASFLLGLVVSNTVLPIDITLLVVAPVYLYVFSIVLIEIGKLHYTPRHYQKWYEKHVANPLDYPLISLIHSINSNLLDPVDLSSYSVIKGVMILEIKSYIENTTIYSRFYDSDRIEFFEDFISKNETQGVSYSQTIQILERCYNKR